MNEFLAEWQHKEAPSPMGAPSCLNPQLLKLDPSFCATSACLIQPDPGPTLPEGNSFSNHWFSGVSFREGIPSKNYPILQKLDFSILNLTYHSQTWNHLDAITNDHGLSGSPAFSSSSLCSILFFLACQIWLVQHHRLISLGKWNWIQVGYIIVHTWIYDINVYIYTNI